MSATRLKNKPLLEINNLPIICHVVKKAKETGIGNVIVATEDKEIVTAVENNDGEAILTGNHKTGTDRIFEAFKKLKIADIDYVVNLQGDEPMIDPKDVVNLNNLMIKTNSDIGIPSVRFFDHEVKKYCYMWREHGEYSRKKFDIK